RPRSLHVHLRGLPTERESAPPHHRRHAPARSDENGLMRIRPASIDELALLADVAWNAPV
ncbi:hypothetical protein ACN6K8_003141, partial [[Kitasatospora] papulosa]|uniref:hypothetical protein n=1 Tax=[Kitasatospora] papulosa TaxID=1464011 RepID=UPI00403C6BBF